MRLRLVSFRQVCWEALHLPHSISKPLNHELAAIWEKLQPEVLVLHTDWPTLMTFHPSLQLQQPLPKSPVLGRGGRCHGNLAIQCWEKPTIETWGEKSTVGFPKKRGSKERRRRTKIREGERDDVIGVRALPWLIAEGALYKRKVHSHVPQSNRSEGTCQLCEMPSTHQHLTHEVPSPEEGKHTCHACLPLMKCSLQTRKAESLTCSDQKWTLSLRAFFKNCFPLLEDNIWNSIFFEKRGSAFNGTYILLACKFVWKQLASTWHCDVAVEEDTRPTHSLTEQQTGVFGDLF